MKEFEDKVAVVTGAASGIGRGMAETFVAAGMKVVLSDIEAPALEETTRVLRAAGAEVHSAVVDVSKADQIERLAKETLSRYGAVHVLCNNAGVVAGGRPSWKSTLDDWAWGIGVNLMGVVHGIRTFLPLMIEQGEEAHIVNTSSMAGLVTGGSLYGTTKSAVVALSEGVHLELMGGGLKPRISVLCPALVATNIFNSERNRPAELSDAGPRPTGPVAETQRQRLAEQIKQALSPRAVGDQVLQAIRDERFYILTHPDWIPLVEHRAKQIANGENPTMLPPPGL